MNHVDPQLVGYAWVSTHDRSAELQHEALATAGCYRIWTDHVSGAERQRPQWAALAEQLRPGDTVVVWRLDRFARSLSHLIATIEDLAGRGVGIKSLTEPIDTTSPTGRLLLHVVGAMAEFERELIRDAPRRGWTPLGRRVGLSAGRA